MVQLPPQYDPYRHYPTIVTLHGAGYTAAQQIDWWAGAWTKNGWRAGQASRQGYIVIAPKWTVEHQRKYKYSAREHAVVLNSLRDACRRFAIDTDRVYISGHSIGGDAAWDIALAHPDLWAGVIPIAALAERYCDHYRENAKLLPFYVVCGELDNGQLIKNAPDLEKYLIQGNCTVGIGHFGRIASSAEGTCVVPTTRHCTSLFSIISSSYYPLSCTELHHLLDCLKDSIGSIASVSITQS